MPQTQTQSHPPPPKPPVIYQISQAALFAPIIALGIGLVTQSTMKESAVSAILIGGVNLLLILTGFILSIISLLAVFKYGPARLLVRGIVGFFLSGLLLAAAIGMFFLFGNINNTIAKRLTGKWHAHTPDHLERDLTLQSDNHFDLSFSGPGGQASLTGTWKVASRDAHFFLVFHTDSSTDPLALNIGKDIGMEIQETHDTQFTFIDSGQTILFNRVP